MPIAEFVNGVQIKEMFYEAGLKISRQRACEIKNQLKKEHPDVILPTDRVIPKVWVIEKYGTQVYRKKKKGTFE